MLHAYEDEDNAPMAWDVPPPYRIITWEEAQEEWRRWYGAEGGTPGEMAPCSPPLVQADKMLF